MINFKTNKMCLLRPSRFIPCSTMSRDIVERGTNRVALISLHYFHMWKNGSIYFRRMYDARLFKPKQTFNRVSPALVFLWKKWFACNNLVLCTYNVLHTYVHRQYMYNCSFATICHAANIARDSFTYVNQIETQRGHIFSGNTFARNLNFPRI